jgi:Xaa-Pro aminopeptidase
MEKELESHKSAAKKLDIIKDKTFDFIKTNLGKIKEQDVQKFILEKFEELELVRDKDPPIVAVNRNTSIVHYFADEKSELIKENSLILLDIWAKEKGQNSVFADITWMAYTGKIISENIQKTFKKVIEARNIGIDFIKEKLKDKKLPNCIEVDEKVRKSFNELSINFLHTTGHSLGEECHSKSFTLSNKCNKDIEIKIPFTIEPGIYFENKFGIRSEIDCYVNEKMELIITTEIQNNIVLI